MPYKIKSLHTLHDGWSRFHLATVRTPEGDEIRRELEDHGAAVAVLPYDPERRVATLAYQFRTPIFHETGNEASLEVPAGLLDSMDPQACARREAEEEVGLALTELHAVGFVFSMPGISTERIHLFLAPYGESSRTGGGGGLAEEGEQIRVEEFPLSRLAAMADEGLLQDMKTLALVQTLRLRRPELFAD